MNKDQFHYWSNITSDLQRSHNNWFDRFSKNYAAITEGMYLDNLEYGHILTDTNNN